ncbi:efflux transporter outer membrane subunit [Massilia sp. HP4]|uniref:efflux transporter outer membrane subunit n=1 Tax=Massilia sp. HP4 TaxID=2562316 RepID=UPI0010BF70FD|nr:efflux transporter outer membrane subunit [Massilia sp. HP4]
MKPWLVLVAAGALLAGCSAGPDFVRPADALQAAALQAREDHADPAPVSSEAVPADWWRLLDDQVLASLQARAQAGNLDLQAATLRIEQGRAQLGIAAAQLLPSVGVGASHAREGLSEHGKFAALGAPTSPSDFWQLAFDASWEIDLWGRARRAREGAAAALQASSHDREAVRVALAAEVARTYLQLRGTQAQLDIARDNQALAERLLRLADNRERHGVATRFDSAAARAQLATVNSTIPDLVARRNTLLNALAQLLGEAPRALDASLRAAMPLPTMPASLPVGLPSELARRRPDILRAEARLHAATAAIGAAKADFYPRVGLRGRFGLEAFDSGDLAGWDARFFSAGPTVYLPLFEGGRLTQRLALSEAGQKEAALAYRQTVLRAWHEVDDALDALAAQRGRHAALETAVEQDRQALHAAERAYQEGAADYLGVLTAQRQLLASQTSLNASATNATLTLVNLYKALGGGWTPDAGTTP